MAKRKITKLTAAQERLLVEHREKWLRIGLCCDPADFATGDEIIRGFYARLNKPAPVILHSGMTTKPVKRSVNGYIISHSEAGHHHLLSGGNVMERTDKVPAGMQVFYALLDKPERFYQNAANPHGEYEMNPGIYELRVSREYDPFAEQARRVAD